MKYTKEFCENQCCDFLVRFMATGDYSFLVKAHTWSMMADNCSACEEMIQECEVDMDESKQ